MLILPQLFDVVADPLERHNLAGSPAATAVHAAIASAFDEEVRQRWDSEQIRHAVIATQRQRRAVHKAMQQGRLTSWDYQPPRDATQEFVRNHMDWPEAAARSRFPPLVE